MSDRVIFVDAGVFLGMHHQDGELRQRSLAFFRALYLQPVWMNYEQVGICDAVIWRQPRAVQDLYYPFMDRLHSDMRLLREGYRRRELELALATPALAELRPEQAVLAAQIVERDAVLATHDPRLRGLPQLRGRLWDFATADSSATFPPVLEALYVASCAFIHSTGE